MRSFALLVLMHPLFSHADNDPRFARAIEKGNVQRIDRCMERFIRRQGRDIQPSTYLKPLGGAEGRIAVLYASLRKQIGVMDLDWDRCVIKPANWPGTWTLGMVYRTRDGRSTDILERCYTIQGGRTGTINLFGWRPKVRKSRDQLKCLGAQDCEGFVELQRRSCDAFAR